MFFQQVFHFSLLDWQKAVLSFGPILLFIFNTSIGFHRPQACFHRQPFNYTLLTGSFMKASLEIDLRTMGFWLLGKRDTTGIWHFRHFFPSFLLLFFSSGKQPPFSVSIAFPPCFALIPLHIKLAFLQDEEMMEKSKALTKDLI